MDKPIEVVPEVLTNIPPEYADEARMFQGIPAIERAPGGRLWAAWYGGGITENRDNYVMLVTSDDDGDTWSGIQMIVDPDGPGPVRAFDPCLWLDPTGRLWLFWGQCDTDFRDAEDRTWNRAPGSGIRKTWAMVTSDPDSASPQWTEPHCVFDGVTMNKPIALSDGRWLACASLWFAEDSAGVVESTDQGATWNRIGVAMARDAETRTFDEHMVVERRDGALWMLVRTKYGIGESVSTDGGRTWSEVAPSAIAHTASRFFIGRLASGNLLLIKHGPIDADVGRSQLAAYVSSDDGATWQGGLMLDERKGVSYPDATQAPDGTIYAIHDFDRYGEKRILLSRFTEDDVVAGSGVRRKRRNVFSSTARAA